MRPRKDDWLDQLGNLQDSNDFLDLYLKDRLADRVNRATLEALMASEPAGMAEAERKEAAQRATLWGCGFDLVTDGLVDMVPYADPDDVKVNDLVIVTQGENAGHVAVVEETHFVSRPHFMASASHARLRRIWPVKWRGPASSYWAPEHRFDAFAQLRPKVPEFPSPEAADWWMHDARKVTVGQEAGFTINTRAYLDEKPWRDRYEEHEYTGTITEITEFDMAFWYRYRPLAKGKFRVLHFDDDMNPLLTWVEEIVRL